MIKGCKGNVFFLICKLLMAAFYIYLNWYKDIRGNQPILLYGITIVLTSMIIGRCLIKGKLVLRNFPEILKTYFIYAVYSLITGIFVAADKEVLLSAIVTFSAFSLMCFNFWYISEESGSTEWVTDTFLLCAVICSVQTIFFGKPYSNGVVVTTMSATSNPNNLALTIFLGIYTIIEERKKHKRSFAVDIFLLIVLFYTIILTGSRKGFIISAFFVIVWVIRSIRTELKENMSLKSFMKMGLCVAIVIGIIVVIVNTFTSTSMYERLLRMMSEGTQNVRVRLYEEAFSFFKESPIVGIGFAQFAVKSQYNLYSHSSYAEILACGGLVGFVLFYCPFIPLIVHSIRRVFRKEKNEAVKYSDTIFAMLLFSELLLGAVIIYIYWFLQMLVLTYLFYIDKKRNGLSTEKEESHV